MKALFLILCAFPLICRAQRKPVPTVEILTQGTKSSLRGLSVVNNQVIWVSGSAGTVGKSTNGGKDWKWSQVQGFEKTEFRDIEAFDASNAVIMGIGSPSYILRTSNGGESWEVVFENKHKDMFLDAMEFWNEKAGIVVGDPVGGRFFVARSFDGGRSWKEIPMDKRPQADSAEAMFAASGTNIRALDNDEAIFITGGTRSRVFIRDSSIRVPLVQGAETQGANSIAVWDRYRQNGGDQLVAVGGDFNKPASDSLNCAISTNRGKTWKVSEKPPHGYRSCVEYLDKRVLVSCGITGVDYTVDNGKTWEWISKEGFNTCRIAKLGEMVYLVGNNGKIARLSYPDRNSKRAQVPFQF